MTEQEHWLPVVGYEGLYEVSDQGRVKRLARVGKSWVLPERILKGCHTHQGYVQVGMFGKSKRVHRLVLEAFVGPCPEGMVACHYDDNKENNRLENLRWDTERENMWDRTRNGNDHNANKTHCPQGHEYTEENIYRRSNGYRQCRACNKVYRKRYREAHPDRVRTQRKPPQPPPSPQPQQTATRTARNQ